MEFANLADDSPYGDIPSRPMRVKVLYSFDSDNKTNCLARLPNTLTIPAVAIDEQSQVGVIELKHCLHAITTASPELSSQLSHGDFAIYAFDYSEQDTPLVGQGMLSAALAAVSPPSPADKTMITGRVCKNMPAIFNNGVKETLEVKLRLVPVPRPAHHMDTRKAEDVSRAQSPAVSAGFDPNAWNASLPPSQTRQRTDYFDFTSTHPPSEQDLASLDEMLGFGTGVSGGNGGTGNAGMGGVVVGAAQTPTDTTYGPNPAFPHSAPGSRAASPMMTLDPNTHNSRLRHPSFSVNSAPDFDPISRPASRASVQGEAQQTSRHHHHDTTPFDQEHSTYQQQTQSYYNEDGQPRKRAKVTQTDWRGRSSFGSKSGDLRVTAATAASVHMHRPIAKRSLAPGTDLEPPPRVPTPVPQRTVMLPQQRVAPRSMLRQASTMDSDLMSDIDQYSDAIMSSPDEESPNNSVLAEGTPQEIPSSPPVFVGLNQPTPSSPGLPTLPPARLADSGYMSERGFNSCSNTVEPQDDDDGRSPDEQDYETARRYQPRNRQPSHSFIKAEESAHGQQLNAPPRWRSETVTTEVRSDTRHSTEMPTAMRQDSQGPHQIQTTSTDNQRPSGSVSAERSPTDNGPQSRRGSLALPSMSAMSTGSSQDSSLRPAPRRRPTKSTRMTSAESEAGSPAPSDNEGRPRGLKRSGSGATRRVVLKERMEKAIAEGGMPQFCVHCGAIETPVWRRLYVKYCDGSPSPLDYAEGEGETIGVEKIETNEETGEVTRFAIRKTLKKAKDLQIGAGFKEVSVCNPCGLWFTKFRDMRPASKWGRKTTTRRSRKQKAQDAHATDGLEPQSEAFFTDQVMPDDANDESGEQSGDGHSGHEGNAGSDNGKDTTHPRPRANSLQPPPARRTNSSVAGLNASQLNAALTRQVQSSPIRFNGSQQAPIEVDLTPKPTRRLLFPSPRREGEVKSLDDNGQASLHATTPAPKGTEGMELSESKKFSMPFDIGNHNLNVFEAFTFDKENIGPDGELPGLDGDFGDLFDGSTTSLFKTPRKNTTPTKSSTMTMTVMTPRSQRQLGHILKTPTPVSRQKRPPLTPNLNATNNADRHDAAGALPNDFMTSPSSSSRYFLRSTPSRQERQTPQRLSAQHGHRIAGAHQSLAGGLGVSIDGQDISPFSRHLAQMLSDVNEHGTGPFTSPSRGGGGGAGHDGFDFGDLPSFGLTPGRLAAGMGAGEVDWLGMDEVLSSEFACFDGSAQQDGRSR